MGVALERVKLAPHVGERLGRSGGDAVEPRADHAQTLEGDHAIARDQGFAALAHVGLFSMRNARTRLDSLSAWLLSCSADARVCAIAATDWVRVSAISRTLCSTCSVPLRCCWV